MTVATYDPYAAPPAETPDASRFALASTPAGWSVGTRAETAVHVYGALVEDRVRESKAFIPPPVEITLKAVVRRGDGYELAPRRSVTGRPVYASRRPTKVWRGLTGAALLDSFFLGEVDGAWGNAPDSEVWSACRDYAESAGLDGRPLRSLNDAAARLVLLRCGLDVHLGSLPNIG